MTPPLNNPEPPTCDASDQSVLERLVKSYYHAKFWGSSSKIEQVMAILVHDRLLRSEKNSSLYTKKSPLETK